MQGDAVWQILVFLLNSFLFVLIGLQLPSILDDLRGADLDTDDLIVYGGVVSRDGDRHAARLGLRLRVPARTSPAARGQRERARSARNGRDRRLDGDARRRLARRRARAPAHDRRGRAVPRARR